MMRTLSCLSLLAMLALSGHAAQAALDPEDQKLIDEASCEEFITGEEHSLETISVGGRAVWHSLTHYYPTPLHVLENPWIQWCLVLPKEVDSSEYNDIRAAGRKAVGLCWKATGRRT